MTAIFRIDQGTTGSPGTARRNLELFSVGGLVTLVADDLSHSIYTWEVVSAPEGSTAASTLTPVGAPATSATVELDIIGSYIFRLTVDDGLVTKDMSSLFGGIPLPTSDMCLPAFNETIQDNSQGSPVYGYGPKINDLLVWVDANVGSGANLQKGRQAFAGSNTVTVNLNIPVPDTSYMVNVSMAYTGGGTANIYPLVVHTKTVSSFVVEATDIVSSDYEVNWIVIP